MTGVPTQRVGTVRTDLSFEDGASRYLRRTVELTASLLLVVEVLLLLAGVSCRYVIKLPLTWSDELAGIVFVWIGMLGAVCAFIRAQHMRLTSFVQQLRPSLRTFFETLGQVIPALILIVLLWPSVQYAAAETPVITPALGVSNALRASALPVGIALMAIVSVARLVALDRRQLVRALAAAAGIALMIWLIGPLLSVGRVGLMFDFVILLLGSVMAGVPIAFSFALVTIVYILTNGHVPLQVIASRMDEGMSGIILLAVPLFVLLGALIEITGLGRAMVNFLVALLGHLRGGLNLALLGAMCVVSGISGAKAADMAAVAPVLFPEMRRRGADEGEMLSLLAASAAMSEIIPPSIVLIAIGSVATVSIAQLFVAGLLPAGILTLVLAALSWWREPVGDRPQQRFSGARLRKSFVLATPALVLPILIRFAVTEGVATATEVSTLAIAYCVLIGILGPRRLSTRTVAAALRDTVALSGMILLIIGAASGMSWALTISGFSQALTSLMGSVPGGNAGFMIASILVFLVLGSILEGIPAMVLLGPLFFPVARTLGINDVHYAIVIVLAMGVGLFSPPFGVGYYSACAIARVDPNVGVRKIWPYMVVLLIGIVLIGFLRFP